MKLSDDENMLTLDDESVHEAVETPAGYSCLYCSLDGEKKCGGVRCSPTHRQDKRNVVFALRKGPVADPKLTGET